MQQTTRVTASILQFKVVLKGTKPPIWRRIQVPASYSFWDFHVAIQDAMGWLDCHLHDFEVFNSRKKRSDHVGIPHDDYLDEGTLPGWEVPLTRYFTQKRPGALYTYDFGDDWEHRILLEKRLPREPGERYPRCTGGRRKCPPEDVGGVWGFYGFLKVLADPKHEEHEELSEWYGNPFDPAEFDPASVVSDPTERFRLAFG